MKIVRKNLKKNTLQLFFSLKFEGKFCLELIENFCRVHLTNDFEILANENPEFQFQYQSQNFIHKLIVQNSIIQSNSSANLNRFWSLTFFYFKQNEIKNIFCILRHNYEIVEL